MTNDVSDDPTSTTDLDTGVEIEIAGPPARRHDATRTRRRRRAPVLVLVATLVGAMVWAGTSQLSEDDHSTPSTPRADAPRRPSATPAQLSVGQVLDGLPQGTAPASAYLQGGSLHVGPVGIRTTAHRLLAAGPTVLVGRSADDPVRWWSLAGSDLLPVPALEGVFTPSLSPSGHLVAWASYPDKQTTRISVLDPTTGTVVDHRDLDAPFVTCCGGGQDVEIMGFDLRDQLYFSQGRGVLVWRPLSGTAPLHVSGGGVSLQVAPAGLVRQGGALGRVDARGHWSDIADLPADQGMVWSADGTLMAYGGDDSGSVAVKESPTDTWVLDPGTGARTRLDLPEGITTEVVAFESDDADLVDAIARPRRHHLLRCSVADGACEQTVPPGPPTWVFPEHSYY